MGMKSSDQADSGGDWRVQLQDMRTRSAFRASAPPPDEVERLSDRALRAAAANPDHSEEARAAAAEALRARRLSPEPWRVRVPGFITARDLEKGDRVFFGAWRAWVRGVALVAIASLVVAGVLTWAEITREQTDKLEAAASMEPCLASGACTAENLAAELAGLDGVWPDFWILALGMLSVVAALAWLALTLLRAKPARLCVVRAQNSTISREPLKRAIASELHPYGHVVVLSADAEGIVVKNAAHYRARAGELRNLIGLNLRKMGTARETVSLSASDAWRPLMLNLLLDSSDAILVDLSDSGSWALDAIIAEGAAPRCVFVALWGKLEEAQAALGAAGLPHRCFAYAPDGEMQQRPKFRAAMLAAMRATHGVAT